MFARALLPACVLFCLLPPVYAQGFRPGQGMKPKLEPFAAEGSIRAVMPGRIQMLTDSTQNWMVFVDPKAVIHVTGTAEPDFVRTGMFIRFTAEVDQRGLVKEKLKQLTIFTPSQSSFPGVWPEGQAPVDGKPAEGQRRFGTGTKDAATAGKAPVSSVYTIAGRITGSRKGQLTVNAGRAVVRVELDEKVKVDVDFADYTVAKPGDRISVTKGKMFAGRMGMAQAQELTVKLSKPLALPKKKPVRQKPPATKRPSEPSKKPDPQPEPLEEKKQPAVG